jgi:hypothetical protein
MNPCESGDGDEDRKDENGERRPPTLHHGRQPCAARNAQGGRLVAHGVIARGVNTRK